jgi:hypothetical protein
MNQVIIVDSGIDPSNKDFHVIGGECVGSDRFNQSINYADTNGHGTFCASVIQRVSPNTGFYVVKILNENGQASSEMLINALNSILKIDIRVVNLSLATLDNEYKNELLHACNELKNDGKILVSSVYNKYGESLPASLPSVIGVNGVFLNNSFKYWFNKKQNIQCLADLTPMMVPTLDKKYKMFGGNSKASALITGIVLNYLQEDQDLTYEELNNVLEERAVINKWEARDIRREIPHFISNIDKSKYPNNLIKEITNIVRNIVGRNIDLQSDDLIDYLKPLDFYYIIKEIEKSLSVTIDYKDLPFDAFFNVFTLIDYIESRSKNV